MGTTQYHSNATPVKSIIATTDFPELVRQTINYPPSHSNNVNKKIYSLLFLIKLAKKIKESGITISFSNEGSKAVNLRLKNLRNAE